jgi:hypothetical protein
MKRIFFVLALVAGALFTTVAQTEPKKVETDHSKTKVKPNTTVKDKAHNVIHPKDKHSHGVKAKHKQGDAKVKAETKPTNS